MSYHFLRVLLIFIFAGMLGLPVAAQQTIDTYLATIGPEDRRNSSGMVLTETAQILAQDRANVHRFSIRHDGDETDRIFQTPEARGRFAELLARGNLGAGVAQAVAGGGNVRVSVQVFGSGNRPDYVTVTLANTDVTDATGETRGLAAQADMSATPDSLTFLSGSGGPEWSFRRVDVQGRQIASMDLQQNGALLIAVRCMATPGSEPMQGVDPRAGVLTVFFGREITGPQTQSHRSIDLATGSRTTMNWPLSFDASVNVYALNTTLTQELQDRLERGAAFHIHSPQTGRLNAPIPQPVGRDMVAACGARGIDPTALPAFQCDRVSHVTEHTICAVPQLAALDGRLDAAYAGAPENLRASQLVWLGARNACRTDVGCIEQAMSERIALLGGQPPSGAFGGTAEAPSGGALLGFGTAQAPSGHNETAPVQPTADTLIGNDAVLDRFLMWAVAQNPRLAAERSIQQRLRNFDFPAGIPEVAARELDPAVWQARLEATIPYYVDNPPVQAILEQPLSVSRSHHDPNGPFEVSGALTTRIGDTAAITRIILRDRLGSGSIGLTLHLDQPFFLPAPDVFTPIPDAMIGPQKGRIIALVQVTLSEHVQDGGATYYRGGTARADIQSVTLVYRPKIRENGSFRDGPDQVLAVWTSEATGGTAVPRPVDARDIAGLFGGGASDDRYLVTAGNMPDGMGEMPSPQIQVSGPRDGIILNMNLAALLNAQPERTLDPELAERVMRSVITEKERVELFPLNIAMNIPGNAPTELELRGALQRNDAELRRRVQDRSPHLPLALRYVVIGALGEFDFDNGGFALRISAANVPWLPTDMNGRTILQHLPDFIEVTPEDGQALIDALSSAGQRRDRRFTVIIDYDMIALPVRPGRSGPITSQEVDSVQPAFASISIKLYAPSDMTQPFHVVPVPDGFETVLQDQDDADGQGGDALPDDVFLTTGKSLLGAIAVLDTDGYVINEAILHSRAVSPSPSSTFAARQTAFLEDLRQSARDSYWIGTSFNTTPYDHDLGGYPLSGLRFFPVGHGEDFDGIEAPPLTIAPEDYAVLRVPPEAADAIADALGDKRTARVYLRVKPVEAVYDGNEGSMLMVSAPLEVIFEKSTGFSLPKRANIRVSLGAPDRLGVQRDDAATDLGEPEALLLDHEGMDLLALALAPDMYNDAMFRRMLVDRLLKERAAAPGGTDLDWRPFFANPDQPLRADAVTEILPEFRDWTLARAAALPDTLLLPIGGQPNPITGCNGLGLTNTAHIAMNEPFFQANLPALLAPDIELSDRTRNLYSNGRPTPGPDGVLHWHGGGRNGGALACRYVSGSLRSLDRGLRPQDAPFVSAMIMVPDMPAVSPVSRNPNTFLYRLSLSDQRILRASELDAVPEGLAGVIVLTADVVAATAYSGHVSGSGIEIVGQITAGDWDPVVAIAPASTDILGLTLETPLADFLAAVKERLPAAATFETVVPGQGMFGHATAIINAETSEALAAIYASHVEGQPVIAVKRRLEFNAAQASVEGLRLAFEDKYGTEYREQGNGQLFWGGLPQEDDTNGYCGAPSVLQNQNLRSVPQLEMTDPGNTAEARTVTAESFLHEFGWPEDFNPNRGGIVPDVARCGTLVAVRIAQSGRKIIAVTWLFDRALAERLNQEPRSAPAGITPEL